MEVDVLTWCSWDPFRTTETSVWVWWCIHFRQLCDAHTRSCTQPYGRWRGLRNIVGQWDIENRRSAYKLRKRWIGRRFRIGRLRRLREYPLFSLLWHQRKAGHTLLCPNPTRLLRPQWQWSRDWVKIATHGFKCCNDDAIECHPELRLAQAYRYGLLTMLERSRETLGGHVFFDVNLMQPLIIPGKKTGCQRYGCARKK